MRKTSLFGMICALRISFQIQVINAIQIWSKGLIIFFKSLPSALSHASAIFTVDPKKITAT